MNLQMFSFVEVVEFVNEGVCVYAAFEVWAGPWGHSQLQCDQICFSVQASGVKQLSQALPLLPPTFTVAVDRNPVGLCKFLLSVNIPQGFS